MRTPVLLLSLLCLTALDVAFADASPPNPIPWRECLLSRVELPADRNPLTRWRPLYSRLVPETPEMTGQLQVLSSPLENPPDPDAAPAFRAWLDSVAPLLPELGLRDNETLQLPAQHGPETPFPDHQPLRQIAAVRLALLKIAWTEGRRENAVQLALDNLAHARAMLSAQEGLIPLIQGTGVWQLALDGVYWLVRQDELSSANAGRLQAALAGDERLATDALIRAFRGEFTFITRVVVDRLPQTRDVDLLLSGISSLGMAPPVPLAEGEPRLAPPPEGKEPFDREATLQAAAEDISGWIAAFGESRHPRNLNATHTYRRLRGYAEELGDLLRYATEDIPPTPERIEQANAVIAHIENPVGKLFLVITTSQWEPLSVTVFRREAQRRALLGMLAWRQQGQPAAWDDLVAGGLLSGPPQDPFSDDALRVGLHPPRIWSIGFNGADDGGAGNGENIGMPDDYTWPSARRPIPGRASDEAHAN